MPFATIDDLDAAREAPLEGRARAVAISKLEAASAHIAGELDRAGIPWRRALKRGAEPFCTNLRAVTCDMVERSLDKSAPAGVGTLQQTAGPYSLTTTFKNPRGDLYLLDSERKALGMGGGHFGTVRPRRG